MTPPDAGTFWYHPHAHSAEQVGRGLMGALIIEEKPDPLPVDRDVVWVLGDFRLGDDASIAGGFDNRMEMSMSGRIGNTVTINGRVPDRFPVRAGERLRLRPLPHSGRPDETQDRRFRLRIPLQYAQVLEDPLLHFLKPEVILIEHLPRMRNLEIVFRLLAPRQVQNKLQIAARHVVIRRAARQPLQPAHLALELFLRFLWKIRFLKALPEQIEIRLLPVFLAQLLLNRPQLLPQQILPLLLRHLIPRARGNLLPQFQDLQLVR